VIGATGSGALRLARLIARLDGTTHMELSELTADISDAIAASIHRVSRSRPSNLAPVLTVNVNLLLKLLAD
jgi:hypothetical protein